MTFEILMTLTTSKPDGFSCLKSDDPHQFEELRHRSTSAAITNSKNAVAFFSSIACGAIENSNTGLVEPPFAGLKSRAFPGFLLAVRIRTVWTPGERG